MRCPLFVVLILTIATGFGIPMKVEYEWKYVDFVWKSAEQKKIEIDSNNYNRSSCVLYDVDRAPDGRKFVTIVRETGVPASLLTISNKTGPGGPLLIPYPNWSWTDPNDCKGIISVYRVSIKCNHLFVLDCGKIGEKKVCPPKLLIFDLERNMLIKRIIIPPNIANNKNGTGLLVTPLAYVRDCRHVNDAIVFMADIEGYGLAMYNEKSGFCRIESKYMEPTNPDFTIQDQSFYLEDGILGLTIIGKYLYYTPLGGNNMYKMNLRNIKQRCSNLSENNVDKLTQLTGTLSGQTAPIASKQCAIFFSNIPRTSILCQDATKEFNSTNTEIIAQDSEKLQFISGMKVTNHEEMLTFLSNRFQRVITDTLNINETNFRILTVSMSQIWKTTNCFASCKDNSKPGHHEHGGRSHGGRSHGGRSHGGHSHSGHWHGGRSHSGHSHSGSWELDGSEYSFDKSDIYDEYDIDDKNDEDDKSDKDNKDDEHSKYHKDSKEDKDNKHDKYHKDSKEDKDDKHDKYHKDSKEDKDDKHDKGDKHDKYKDNKDGKN